ncbi:head GIN domain-containing protein [Prolixibacter denitrificans]|uniref:DUF2807 domain-containing protein n=1 Tax=Prolixibacter denitrificans TaxID=1541063 RepID=A0A2P8CFA5_9BACT|nr:head GIN domain-containing protein [Prolixibacter denitrificans]PSK83673.1 putative autotransporter adhesin-like protein [Prolixibacter denitrificans]GET23218.1 DUF2807 domain-containing protein [Prolixibacter denitrificans]
MKRPELFITALMVPILLLISCDSDTTRITGEGPVVTKTITVPDFTGIDLAGAANIIITQGATQTVEVSAQQNIIDRLETNVSGGIWTVKLEDGNYTNYDLTIYITVPTISSLLVSGSGNIKVNDFTGQDDLALTITGSGNIEMNAFGGCENLSVTITGSGNVMGTKDFSDLKNLDVVISGSGNFAAYPIVSDNCHISIPGSGVCFVTVNDTLNISISGSGSVFYRGSPTVTQTITGSGVVMNTN